MFFSDKRNRIGFVNDSNTIGIAGIIDAFSFYNSEKSYTVRFYRNCDLRAVAVGNENVIADICVVKFDVAFDGKLYVIVAIVDC